MISTVYSPIFHPCTSLLTIGNTCSGKTETHFSYLKNPIKYFNRDFLNVIVVTNYVSVDMWNIFFENNCDKLSFKVYDYQHIIKSTEVPDLIKETIVIFDDLLPKIYDSVKEILDQIILVNTHHLALNLFIITQNVLNCSLKELLLKVDYIQINVLNQSSYRFLKYICSYHFSTNEKKCIFEAYEICKHYNKIDTFLRLNMKKNNSGSLQFKATINNMFYTLKLPCLAYDEYDCHFECVRLVNNESIKIFDYASKGLICELDIVKFATLLKSIMEGNSDRQEFSSYVLFPKLLFDKLITLIKETECEDNEGKAQVNKLYSEYNILKSNLLNGISANFPIKRINSAKRIAEELLINSSILFLGTSGRVFKINSLKNVSNDQMKKLPGDPLKINIITFDFLSEVTKIPFLGLIKGKKKNNKSNPMYQIIINILLNNAMPKFYIKNKNYLKT